MTLLGRLMGEPLANAEESTQKLGVLDGVPVFGLDALGSAAYGPEAALTVLIPLRLLELRYILPLSTVVVALLVLVCFPYRQTIDAYPGGGGAYTVAGQNLGKIWVCLRPELVARLVSEDEIVLRRKAVNRDRRCSLATEFVPGACLTFRRATV